MQTKTDEPLKTLKGQVLEYIDLKSEYIRLTAIEYAAKTASFMFSSVMQLLIIFMFVLFLTISVALFLGNYFHSYGMGFLATSLFFLLGLLCFMAFGKKIARNYIVRKIIEITKK